MNAATGSTKRRALLGLGAVVGLAAIWFPAPRVDAASTATTVVIDGADFSCWDGYTVTGTLQLVVSAEHFDATGTLDVGAPAEVTATTLIGYAGQYTGNINTDLLPGVEFAAVAAVVDGHAALFVDTHLTPGPSASDSAGVPVWLVTVTIQGTDGHSCSVRIGAAWPYTPHSGPVIVTFTAADFQCWGGFAVTMGSVAIDVSVAHFTGKGAVTVSVGGSGATQLTWNVGTGQSDGNMMSDDLTVGYDGSVAVVGGAGQVVFDGAVTPGPRVGPLGLAVIVEAVVSDGASPTSASCMATAAVPWQDVLTASSGGGGGGGGGGGTMPSTGSTTVLASAAATTLLFGLGATFVARRTRRPA